MIGLRELRLADPATWDDAARFAVPPISHYRIADDCLRAEPNKVAIIEVLDGAHRTLTFGELDARSARLANHLMSIGVGPGDRVAIKLSQSIDMAIAVFGVLRAGGIVLPVSNVLAAGGLDHRLSDADPTVIIHSADDTAAREAGQRRSIRSLITRRGSDGAPTLEEIVASGPGTVICPTAGHADEPALLLYTSGTSGKPKGVLQAQRFLLGHHALDIAFDRIRDDDVAYSPVDWTWAGGLMLGLLVPLAHGVTVVASREPGFDPPKVFDMMRSTHVSIGLFPPTVLRMMRKAGVLDADAVASTRLRCFITGAESVEPELIEWTARIGLVVNNAYGQTEANALIGHAACLGDLDQRSMGRVYPGHTVEVLDDQLQPADVGVAGQVAVRADDLVCMLEYWRNAAATASKIVDGWLLTGDTAHRNSDGTMYFHGRNDDIIKSGAYRLGPAEIEAAVLRAPDVVACAVIGLPDPVRGEIVSAVVELAAGATPNDAREAAIVDLVRSTVGAHAYPRDIRYIERLPRTTTGKVDRASLRTSITAELQERLPNADA